MSPTVSAGARGSGLPLFYRAYPGNLHDSRLFAAVIEEMIGVIDDLQQTKQRLTVVVDKGMNSTENFLWLDEHPRMHFVTTYSPHYVEDLMSEPLDRFSPVELPRNRRLCAAGRPEDQMLALRTLSEFWGQERTVVVTYNPLTAEWRTEAGIEPSEGSVGQSFDNAVAESLIGRADVVRWSCGSGRDGRAHMKRSLEKMGRFTTT